jgi:hypothetical protein
MRRRICRHNVATFSRKTTNTPGSLPSSLSDRTIILDMFAELVRLGYGVLEEVPNLNSQILHLKSGKIYWLGRHDIMRIR